MSSAKSYTELIASQIPALQLLIHMGWTYLTPDEALALRGGKEKNVILTGILEPWLRQYNQFERKRQRHPFSDKSIKGAIAELTDLNPAEGLMLTNAALYETLTLGSSQPETVDGDTKSHTLHYIDWHTPSNNVYHVTEEFSVERRGSHEKRRPDMVLFVNGIPLVVIEAKRADLNGEAERRDPSVVGEGEPEYINKPAAEAISQMIRNQGEENIPHLFAYSQLLMAIHPNEALYATTGTGKKFWSLWREAKDTEPQVAALINQMLSPEIEEYLYDWRPQAKQIRQHFRGLGERLPNVQDRFIYALLRPGRLLELIYGFIVFDNGVKKVARYQQYFAVKAMINRVAHINPQGRRTGGVIWHTTGSGKSLTMVMMAKALALHPSIQNPRVVLVTDRVNLDQQIYRTFHACGKNTVQASSGGHLVRLINGKVKRSEKRADIVTTIINKFDEAARSKVRDESRDIFVLVDESHRSQYGSMHAKMAQVFPNACYIGFTGTPLTKKEKSTAEKFGSFIHTYPMRDAVRDGAVVPLLYEGRVVEQDVDKAQLERWFERTTRHLSDEQRADLKRKMSRSEAINATDQRIREIAYNIAEHYERNWRGSGFKGQLAAQSKAIALKYAQYLEEYGIRAALIISPPDTREGHDEIDGANLPAVQGFWKGIMAKHGTEDAYNRAMLASFADADGVEILVVVDKLLTGFDEPRNVVLYVDKSLKEHTLLQAIARVNRLADGKDYGYIIDYRGVLGELNEAMNLYDALADYDPSDVADTLTDVSEEIARLPDYHAALWGIFEPVGNKNDNEAMERFLEPEDRRNHFYEALTDYARVLKVALSSSTFYETTPEARIETYKRDLRYFHRLRSAIRLRYAEAIDYREYEDKVRQLMDDHIRATGTTQITSLVNIFDVERFDQEVAALTQPAAQADTILNRMKRTITEYMDEDPAFYKRFSDLVEEAIQAYRQGRMDELEYQATAAELLQQMRDGHRTDLPPILDRYEHAPAFFGILQEAVTEAEPKLLAAVAVAVEEIIAKHRVIDWTHNLDVQNRIMQEVDDLLFDRIEALSGAELDMLIEQFLEVAKVRDRRS